MRRADNNCSIVSQSGYIWIWSGARDQELTNHNARLAEWKSRYITIIIDQYKNMRIWKLTSWWSNYLHLKIGRKLMFPALAIHQTEQSHVWVIITSGYVCHLWKTIEWKHEWIGWIRNAFTLLFFHLQCNTAVSSETAVLLNLFF